MGDIVERLIESWERTARLHCLAPGAGDAELRAYGREAGRALPAPIERLYRHTNGMALFNGNIRLFPLTDFELCVQTASDAYRAWDWSIPDELVLVGDDGTGDPFGLWLPDGPAESAPVVEAGRMFESGSYAIAATSLERYLLARTAYYLLLIGAERPVLDLLELPPELRGLEEAEPPRQALLDWADPERPDTPSDPYEARLDAQALRSAMATACLAGWGGAPN